MQPYLTMNYCIALQGIFPSRSGIEQFVGEICLFGFNFAPKGWATCDGQLLNIAQNTALFALLGTQYGGNGTTTFALPDLRGRTTMHMGQGPGLTNRVIGEKFGTETVPAN
jgi:microcystin-dependent protein